MDWQLSLHSQFKDLIMSDKKLVIDISKGETKPKEIPLTPQEVAQKTLDEEKHNERLAEYEKVKHLDDMKRDSKYPSLEEFVQALWEKAYGDSTKADAINNNLEELKQIYKPNEII
jgi:hypothetical protein